MTRTVAVEDLVAGATLAGGLPGQVDPVTTPPEGGVPPAGEAPQEDIAAGARSALDGGRPDKRVANGGRIVLDGVGIHLGEGRQRFEAIRPLTLTLEAGEIVCVLGPSGCGKSTLLGALAGHLMPSSGQVLIDGVPVTGPDPRRGIVFQHHTLFPWLDAVDNVSYGLKMRGEARAARRSRARALLASIGLKGFEQHYPSQLSGGMQQRVEIARVLINDPKVLLMDEPFSALDALTRLKMHDLLLALWARHRPTIVFVTHDIDEALVLADRILVMSPRPGRLIDEIGLEQGRPRGDDWRTSPHFARIRRHCLQRLRDDEAPRESPASPPDGHFESAHD